MVFKAFSSEILNTKFHLSNLKIWKKIASEWSKDLKQNDKKSSSKNLKR